MTILTLGIIGTSSILLTEWLLYLKEKTFV
jgi:hypothetical protein